MSNLAALLRQGEFVVTAELNPPKSASGAVVNRRATALKGSVDAVNVTDSNHAVVAMSAIPAAVLVREAGVEPVVQITGRDRNRIALQADLHIDDVETGLSDQSEGERDGIGSGAGARRGVEQLVQFLPWQVRSWGRRPHQVRQGAQVLLESPDRGRDALLEGRHVSSDHSIFSKARDCGGAAGGTPFN